MDNGSSFDHFEGKTPSEHILEARKKAKLALDEVHGEEMSGWLNGFLEATKETCVLFALLWIAFPSKSVPISVFSGWLIWKMAKTALLGWRRLGRLHRIIEEEKWEIEHRRAQEREELIALYENKGFTGKLLQEVVDTLMADDQRLLQIMLEEELIIPLETYEHPLYHCLSSGAGVLLSGFLLYPLTIYFSFSGLCFASLSLIFFASYIGAIKSKNSPLVFTTWTIGSGILVCLTAYFLQSFLLNLK